MKKILSLLLALGMILALCACSSTPAPTAAPTEAPAEATEAPAEDAETPEEPAEFTTVAEGKLIMATNAAFPPYEFISDEDGETIVGIDAEIAGAIAEALGLELQIEDMEFSSVLTAVQTGKADVGLGAITVTEERLQNVNFSSTYATGVQSIIVPEGSPITCLDDLYAEGADYTIGVQESTTGHIYCEDDFGADRVTAFSTGANAVQALLSGKVDCVIIDNEPAKSYVAANEGLVILETAYAVEDYAIAVSKDNEALLAAVNKALDSLIADGTVKGILDKYIPAE